MKLTPDAAADVCRSAAARGLAVLIVEGGIWRDPGFEPRVDCIWNSCIKLLSSREGMILLNKEACEFVEDSARRGHSAFILSVDLMQNLLARYGKQSDAGSS